MSTQSAGFDDINYSCWSATIGEGRRITWKYWLKLQNIFRTYYSFSNCYLVGTIAIKPCWIFIRCENDVPGWRTDDTLSIRNDFNRTHKFWEYSTHWNLFVSTVKRSLLAQTMISNELNENYYISNSQFIPS